MQWVSAVSLHPKNPFDSIAVDSMPALTTLRLTRLLVQCFPLSIVIGENKDAIVPGYSQGEDVS